MPGCWSFFFIERDLEGCIFAGPLPRHSGVLLLKQMTEARIKLVGTCFRFFLSLVMRMPQDICETPEGCSIK